MKRNYKASILPLALVAAFIGACASLGTPEDQDEGSMLWNEMKGYQSWTPYGPRIQTTATPVG